LESRRWLVAQDARGAAVPVTVEWQIRTNGQNPAATQWDARVERDDERRPVSFQKVVRLVRTVNRELFAARFGAAQMAAIGYVGYEATNYLS
jgi:hypothetical protein